MSPAVGPTVPVPHVLLADHRLSTTARGLAATMAARDGCITLEAGDPLLDASAELLVLGYAVLGGNGLTLTSLAGWSA